MQLEILGANATAPTSHGASSGYVVHTDDGLIIVDAGPGSMAAYVARHPLEKLRAIVITHVHADHCLDLMAWAYRWTFPTVLPSIPLWMPPGAEDFLTRFDELFAIPTLPTMHSPIRQSFDVHTMSLDGRTRYSLPGCELISFEAKHAVPSAALRFVANGVSLAFSSDTGDCPGVRAAADGVALFVCEATWLAAPAGESAGHGHLTAANAGSIASAAGVATLVLTHLSDPANRDEALRDASSEFSGEILVGLEHSVVDLTNRAAD